MLSVQIGTRWRIATAVIVVAVGPAFWLSAQEPPSVRPEQRVVSTMPGMRSLVPTLVVTGWMEFFLDLRQPMGLTDDQTRQLSLIRQSYLAFLQQKGAKLSRVELNLYQDMASDIVTSEKLGEDIQAIAQLKASIAEAHFTAVLEAINVLNHRQHLGANKWLKLRLRAALRRKPGERELNAANQKARGSRHFKWPFSFTFQQPVQKEW